MACSSKSLLEEARPCLRALARQYHDGLNPNSLRCLISIVLSVAPSKREACSSPCHEGTLSLAGSRLMIFVR